MAEQLPAGQLSTVRGRVALAVLCSAFLIDDAAVLIAARAGQGAAGAVLMPAALSLVLRTFTGDAEQRQALAVWSAIGGVGSTAGLLLGGAVTVSVGWRWVFLVNVPVSAVLLAASPSVLAEAAAGEQSRKTDVAGTVSFSAGMALLIYAISQVPSLGWTDWRSCGLGLAGIAVLGAFARIQVTSPSPIIPSWLARSRTLIAGNLTMLVAGMFVDGALFVLTLFTQRAWGYSPLQFAAAASAMTTTSVAAAWVAQRAIAKRGTRAAVIAAAGLAATAVFSGRRPACEPSGQTPG